MKKHILLVVGLLPLLAVAQQVIHFRKLADRVEVTTQAGVLDIVPLNERTVRITFGKINGYQQPEWIFPEAPRTPAFKVVDSEQVLQVVLDRLIVHMDKTTGCLHYADANGKVFLSEQAGSRKLVETSIQGEPCVDVKQGFVSPLDEALFGLGQFQDGQFNLRGVTRRLTQVNTQIAIPFIYSSKGYGLLWHQYGLTDYNPTSHTVNLQKLEQSGNDPANVAEVTTTSGTQKVAQGQTLYEGVLDVPSNDDYSLFLDLGEMGNRHFVSVDGKPVVDQSNMWLPPTVGMIIHLKAGSHRVQVLCKSTNQPQLSWEAVDNLTTFRSPVAKALDYVVFYGPKADAVIASFRSLSGNAPMFPKWAYGFWQCRERYSSGKQLVETVAEFRRRNLPLDVIVQDWQYWGNRGWGVPQFDESNYPDPAGFIKELHDLNAHFNVSIWSNPDKGSTLGQEYVRKGRYMPNTKWLDYFNPETRKDYWNTLKVNMFDNGVDSWWMDAVEPENDALKGEKTFMGPGDFYRLTYPLMVSRSVYEGQREASNQKRVCILTRSAFPGQQRYGIINWSGDVGYTWEVFQTQIVAGLNYCLSGFPYWTTDIGGFFRPGRSQYTDANYHELLTRWFQWGAFCPIFRIHGYMTETEPWKYGSVVEENMRKTMNLRYRLLPYIYSEAGMVTQDGSTLMRALVMDFNGDTAAMNCRYEYLFGKSMLVAPVTEPGLRSSAVYLPKTTDWYDFWTGKRFAGGQQVTVEAPLDKIPLFVKAGSILPIGPAVQYADEKKCDALDLCIYPGADGSFTLYEDEGDGYGYEQGLRSTIRFSWNERDKTLTLGARKGAFPGMTAERSFRVVLAKGFDSADAYAKEVRYSGKEIFVRLK
jgi:alpha-D-xyloside xylohydrolase